MKTYCVIGHPIGHTMSPFIHKRLFQLSGANADYGVLDIAPQALEAKMPALAKYSGYNVTIPHKQAILPLLARVDDRAAQYGAVNCVCNTPRGAVGYNTDGEGFRKALEAADIPFGDSVLICGCGGVARTIAFEAARAGASVVFAVRREDPAARTLCAQLPCEASLCLLAQAKGPFSLVVNATPVGMYPHCEDMPLTLKQLDGCGAVFDAVYNPIKTRLLQAAQANEMPALGGLSMLVWQAVAAHEIWYGARFALPDIQTIIADAAAELERVFDV